MRVLSKLSDYSEYLQRTSKITTETHPKIDIQLINSLVNKVASKGRYTLTEIEGYDVFNLCGIQTPSYKLFTNGQEAGSFVEVKK